MITNVLDDPYLWVLVFLVGAAALVAGRIRRQPPWAVAMTAAGVIAFLIGMKLLSDLGGRALVGGLLATGGFALWVQGARQRRPVHPPASK